MDGKALLQELAARDPEAAAAMDFHNHKRLLRSLELCITTGKTAAQRAEESRSIPSPDICSFLCLWFADRQKLYDRMDKRVDGMMQEGLFAGGGKPFSWVSGKNSPPGDRLQESFFPIFQRKFLYPRRWKPFKRETRRYAKRQLTWFRREKEAVWLDVGAYSSLSALADAAEGICREKLKDFEECFPKYSLGANRKMNGVYEESPRILLRYNRRQPGIAGQKEAVCEQSLFCGSLLLRWWQFFSCFI